MPYRAQRLESCIQAFVLAEFGVVLGDLWQCRIVSLAQFRAVHHGVEMADLAPGAVQAFVGVFQRADKVVPVRRCLVGGDACDQGAVFRQQLVNGRCNVGGFELGKAGQTREIEQGIHE